MILVCTGQRRIVKGEEVNREKRYMVYFLSAEDPESTYRDWLCAGALISTSHVLTAAACLTDVSRLYVIAGYKKYVNGMDVDKDNCTSKRKRRVVRICTPGSYSLSYEKLSDWMKIDIGIATVDVPYDFDDETFRLDCSYPPNKIDINYDPYLQRDDTSAIVMGWGSRNRFRQPNDVVDNNSEYLKYARTRLKPIDDCVKSFTNHSGAGDVIKEFMICSGSEGFFDIDGKETKGILPHTDGCKKGIPKNPNATSSEANNPEANKALEKNANRTKPANFEEGVPEADNSEENGASPGRDLENEQQNSEEIPTMRIADKYKVNDGESDSFDWRRAGTRHDHRQDSTSYENDSEEKDLTKPGFCQNDHGAPLVTWSGVKEYVIGVASACIVRTETLLCMPPYLYTSTYCSGLFLQCVLSGSASTDIRRKCEEIAKEKGIAIEDHPVVWSQKQESESNKQTQQEKSPIDMRAEDYAALEEGNTELPRTILRSNKAMETQREPEPQSESLETITVVNNPVDDFIETTTEDELEMMFRLNTLKERKIWIEPRTVVAVTEGEFDPYALLEEFMEDTVKHKEEIKEVETISNEESDTHDPRYTTLITEDVNAESTASPTENKTVAHVVTANNLSNAVPQNQRSPSPANLTNYYGTYCQYEC